MIFITGLSTALQTIGAVTVVFLIYKVSYSCSLWLLPIRTLAKYLRPSKAWALITGSSAGIGFGCAQELADRGFNIILLGHLRDELETARNQIKFKSPTVDIRIEVCDVTSAKTEDISALVQSINTLPITVLINNVGGMPIPQPRIRPFNDFTAAGVDATINMNARFMSQLTLALLPTLCSNCPSLILNLSSGGKLGLPGLVMYSATKSFVSAFSKALAREAKAFGLQLNVLSVVPGDTHSQANNKALMAGSPTSRQLAKVLMDVAPRAASRGMLEFSPYFMHAVPLAVVEWMPEWLLFSSVLKGYEDKRKAYEEDAKKD